MNAIHSLLSSIHAGQQRLARAAGAVAGGTVPTSADTPAGAADRVDLSREAVELLRAEHDVAVSARALARVDEAQDALLDALD